MRLTSRHLRLRYRNGGCTIRVTRALAGHDVDEGPSEFAQGLFERGLEHERDVLAAHGEHLDLSDGTREERVRRTIAALARPPLPVLYHPLLQADIDVDGTTIELRGEPDLLVASEHGGWNLIDAKLSSNHLEQGEAQLGVYALLVEQLTGSLPKTLALELPGGERLEVAVDAAVARALDDIRYLCSMQGAEPDDEPVGKARCEGCRLHHECWSRAVRDHDVAVLPAVRLRAARVLHHHGIGTLETLADADVDTLTVLTAPEHLGAGGTGIGATTARRMIAQAMAFRAGAAHVVDRPELPDGATWIAFDVENVEQAAGEPIRVFQWGLKPQGGIVSNELVDVATEATDRAGWRAFLAQARALIDAHDDARFVHWSHHDRNTVTSYVDRFGDEDGTAAEVVDRCVDLCKVLDRSCELPTLDRSIKKVAAWLEAPLPDHGLGGTGAMAAYRSVMSGAAGENEQWTRSMLLRYNESDLDAVLHVLDWTLQWADSPPGALIDRHGGVLDPGELDTPAVDQALERPNRVRVRPSDRIPEWRMRRIEELAETLIQRASMDAGAVGPIDIHEIARRSQLAVVTSPHGIAGLYTVNDDGTPLSGYMKGRTLYVDGREPERRQRFTIAHELAHVALGHMEVLGATHVLPTDAVDDDVERVFEPRAATDAHRSMISKLVEREADHLAGLLLVPERALDAAVRDHGACLPLLAEVFDVSVPLIRVRLGGRVRPRIRRVSVW